MDQHLMGGPYNRARAWAIKLTQEGHKTQRCGGSKVLGHHGISVIRIQRGKQPIANIFLKNYVYEHTPN